MSLNCNILPINEYYFKKELSLHSTFLVWKRTVLVSYLGGWLLDGSCKIFIWKIISTHIVREVIWSTIVLLKRNSEKGKCYRWHKYCTWISSFMIFCSSFFLLFSFILSSALLFLSSSIFIFISSLYRAWASRILSIINSCKKEICYYTFFKLSSVE